MWVNGIWVAKRTSQHVNIGGCDYGRPVSSYFSPYHIPTFPDGPQGEYLTDLLTNEIINLIKNKQNEPFFLNLWHYTVHTPLQVKEKDIKYFEKICQDMNFNNKQEFVECGYYPVHHMRNLVLKKTNNPR
ncbi:MAG: sulfatase-like hydrolase/transferase [Bacilli bacterium]|nr:sulfatase-like hydrolase/transferase [Bacilli bacterium]